MYEEIVIVNKNEHLNKGAKSFENYSYAKGVNSSIITSDEFYEVCKYYPILFSKNEDGWYAMALFGLDGKNLFLNKKGEWKKDLYIPAYIRRYPFIYVKNNDELYLGIDTKALIEKSEAKDRYFFEEDGTQSEFVKKILKYLDAFHLQSLSTSDFIKKLEELGVLEESLITKKEGEKEKKYGNIWIVNEKKLDSLKEEEKAALCKNNYMKLITAHLISLSNIKKIS